MTPWGLRLVLLAVVVSTIGCDRVTKHVAEATLAGGPTQSFLSDVVRLGYAENTGGFLSLGADLPGPVRTLVFTVGTSLLLLVAITAAVRLRLTGWPLAGLSLAFAGAASNLVDRIVRGSVVDFLNVGIGPVRTGIFNVADVAVMVGLGILAITLGPAWTDAELAPSRAADVPPPPDPSDRI